MAILLRQIEGETVALCANYSEPQETDIYIDDNQQYALACKFSRDTNHMFPEMDLPLDKINNELAKQECGCPACQTTTRQ